MYNRMKLLFSEHMEHLESASKSLCNFISVFFRRTNPVLPIIFVCGLVAHGYELTHGPLSFDEEIYWDKNSNYHAWQGSLGRWAMYVFARIIFPGLHFSFISCIFSILFLSFAITAWIYIHKTPSSWSAILYGILILSCPVNGEMLSFSFMAAQVFFSEALIVIAYIFITNNYQFWIKYLISTILISFSIATYQALILIPYSLFIIDNYKNIFSYLTIKKFIEIFCILLAAIIIYACADQFLKYTLNISKNDYLINQIGWISNSIPDIKITLERYFNYLLHDSYSFSLFAYSIVPSCLIILNMDKKINAICLIFVMYIYSFIIYLFFGAPMPARTLLYMSIIFGGFFYISYIVSKQFGKVITSILSIWIFICACSINTNNSVADELARDKDMLIAYRIVNNIYDLCPDYLNKARTIAFCGNYSSSAESERDFTPTFNSIVKRDSDSIFGKSYFKIEPDQYGRIKNYMELLGMELPWLESSKKRDNIMLTKEFSAMPSYPDKNSVRIIDSVLIVKFSN